MRRLILALTVTLAPAAAAAQSSALDRGSLLVDGSASFVSTGAEDSDDRFTTLSVTPGVKYFIVPRLAVGGRLHVSRLSSENSSSTTFGIGPSIDYYFGDLDVALHPFLSATTFLSWSRSEASAFEDAEARVVTIEGEAGLLYLFSQQVGLRTALFYQSRSFDAGGGPRDQNSFGLSMGLSAFVF